ncbi:MAG: CsbD family protein [Acidobacteriaceae bacterium]|nr:CsbD family protein [Acidobacteriaceae bacterium]
MNSDQFEGKWKQLKGSVKQRWGKLTDDDVTTLSGKKDELIGRLQERYGITREQATREADEWAAATSASLDELDAKAGTSRSSAATTSKL